MYMRIIFNCRLYNQTNLNIILLFSSLTKYLNNALHIHTKAWITNGCGQYKLTNNSCPTVRYVWYSWLFQLLRITRESNIFVQLTAKSNDKSHMSKIKPNISHFCRLFLLIPFIISVSVIPAVFFIYYFNTF